MMFKIQILKTDVKILGPLVKNVNCKYKFLFSLKMKEKILI